MRFLPMSVCLGVTVLLPVACDIETELPVLRTGLDIDSSRLMPGLAVQYVEGDFASPASVSEAETIHTGVSSRVELLGIERQADFGLRFRGYLRVPYDDLYTFETTSDQGLQLIIDEEVVINQDAGDEESPRRGTIGLAKGHHRLRINYVQGAVGRKLALRVRRGDGPLALVPDGWYYVEDPLAPDVELPLTDAP